MADYQVIEIDSKKNYLKCEDFLYVKNTAKKNGVVYYKCSVKGCPATGSVNDLRADKFTLNKHKIHSNHADCSNVLDSLKMRKKTEKKIRCKIERGKKVNPRLIFEKLRVKYNLEHIPFTGKSHFSQIKLAAEKIKKKERKNSRKQKQINNGDLEPQNDDRVSDNDQGAAAEIPLELQGEQEEEIGQEEQNRREGEEQEEQNRREGEEQEEQNRLEVVVEALKDIVQEVQLSESSPELASTSKKSKMLKSKSLRYGFRQHNKMKKVLKKSPPQPLSSSAQISNELPLKLRLRRS